MESYKEHFIDFLWESGALKIGQLKEDGEMEKWTLKSGRESPWFVNLRGIADGKGFKGLSRAYASAITNFTREEKIDFDKVFGPADAGIPYAVSTVMALDDMGLNKDASFNRKKPKVYGEALQGMLKKKSRREVVDYLESLLEYDSLPDNITPEDFQKMWLSGSKIEDGDKIIIIDDVFTTGQTKYDSINLLNKCADGLQYKALVIAVDRQEVADDGGKPTRYGRNAIDDFNEKTDIPVYSIVNAGEVYMRLSETGRLSEKQASEFRKYLMEYGTYEVKVLFQGVVKNE